MGTRRVLAAKTSIRYSEAVNFSEQVFAGLMPGTLHVVARRVRRVSFAGVRRRGPDHPLLYREKKNHLAQTHFVCGFFLVG